MGGPARLCRAGGEAKRSPLKHDNHFVDEEEVAVLGMAHRAALETTALDLRGPARRDRAPPVAGAALAREALAERLHRSRRRVEPPGFSGAVVTHPDPHPEELHLPPVLVPPVVADGAARAHPNRAGIRPLRVAREAAPATEIHDTGPADLAALGRLQHSPIVGRSAGRGNFSALS